MVSGDYLLETEGLTKEFKGFFAVRNVDLRIRRGAVHALIGPNGAGKTTVFNLLTKFRECQKFCVSVPRASRFSASAR